MTDYQKMFNTKTINLKEFKKKFSQKVFNDSGLFSQVEAGWYYFECPVVSLKYKTKLFANILKQLGDITPFDVEKYSAMFMNTKDCFGNQTDRMRIYNIETDEVLYNVDHLTVSDSFKIFCKNSDVSHELGTVDDVAEYLNSNSI